MIDIEQKQFMKIRLSSPNLFVQLPLRVLIFINFIWYKMRKQFRPHRNQQVLRQKQCSFGLCPRNFETHQPRSKDYIVAFRSFNDQRIESNNGYRNQWKNRSSDRGLPQTTLQNISCRGTAPHSFYNLFGGSEIESIRSQGSSIQKQKNHPQVCHNNLLMLNPQYLPRPEEKVPKILYDKVVKKYKEIRKINCNLELQNNRLKIEIEALKKQQKQKQTSRVPHFIRMRQQQKNHKQYLLYTVSESVSLSKLDFSRL